MQQEKPENVSEEEGVRNQFCEKAFMLKMADILRQNNLITFEEQEKAKQLIRESEEI